MTPWQQLMYDWLDAEISVTCEHSGNMAGDIKALLARARLRCVELQIEWSDEFIPDWVVDALEWQWNEDPS